MRHFSAHLCRERVPGLTSACPVCVRRGPRAQLALYPKEELMRHLRATHLHEGRREQGIQLPAMDIEMVPLDEDDNVTTPQPMAEETEATIETESLSSDEEPHVLFGDESESESDLSGDEWAGLASETDAEDESPTLVPEATALQTTQLGGTILDYGFHATGVRVDRAVALFRFALLLLGKQVTESLLEGFAETVLELHGHSLFRTLPG